MVLAGVLFVLSLQGISVLVLLEHLPGLQRNPAGVAILGVGCLLGFGALALACFRWCGCSTSLAAAFFAVTTWSAMIDLVLAAALVNATTVSCSTP